MYFCNFAGTRRDFLSGEHFPEEVLSQVELTFLDTEDVGMTCDVLVHFCSLALAHLSSLGMRTVHVAEPVSRSSSFILLL